MTTTFQKLSIAVCFLALAWRSAFCATDYHLIINMTRIDHTVRVFTSDDSTVVQRTIMNDVVYFDADTSGYYIAKKRDGTWVTGHCLDNRKTTYIKETLVPAQCEEAVISPDGRGIIWTATDSKRWKLYLTDLLEETTYIIRVKTGRLEHPGWSPDSRKIAYYSGNDIGSDGFSVCIIDIPPLGKQKLDTIEWEEHVIAPPSELTRAYPERSESPCWSPDGKRLLFEARYMDQPSTRYMINCDGTSCHPIPEGYIAWIADGASLFSIIYTHGNANENKCSGIQMDPLTLKVTGTVVSNIPKTLQFWSISPDGQQYLAFAATGCVWVKHKSGRQIYLNIDPPIFSRVTWVTY